MKKVLGWGLIYLPSVALSAWRFGDLGWDGIARVFGLAAVVAASVTAGLYLITRR